MSEQQDVREILVEIRDNQRKSLDIQEKHVALAREQLDRAKSQVEESLALQREAVAKQQLVMRMGLPAIALCILVIVYLVIRYF
jgi:hypothetical protein